MNIIEIDTSANDSDRKSRRDCCCNQQEVNGDLFNRSSRPGLIMTHHKVVGRAGSLSVIRRQFKSPVYIREKIALQ